MKISNEMWASILVLMENMSSAAQIQLILLIMQKDNCLKRE